MAFLPGLKMMALLAPNVSGMPLIDRAATPSRSCQPLEKERLATVLQERDTQETALITKKPLPHTHTHTQLMN
jgi:hypothetical protein